MWISVCFKDQKEINNNSHLCFPFVTRSLNDLTSFSMYLQDDKNKEKFNSGEKKNKYIKFSDWCLPKMSKTRKFNRTSQQIKEEPINFLLEDVEKKLEEYKRALELN